MSEADGGPPPLVGDTGEKAGKAGSGRPRALRCWQCKRNRLVHHEGIRLELTGRTEQRRVRGVPRDEPLRIEYACLDCGHMGWSTHTEAKDLPERPS